jgi:NitT/TauT family transport system substrate-binding protein
LSLRAKRRNLLPVTRGEGMRFVAMLAAALAIAGAASAQTKIRVAYTATGGFIGAFVAADKGFFEKRGLDIAFQLIGLNSNIPPAMVAGSIDIGGTTTTGLLQAADSGIPLVVVSGGAATVKGSTTGALLAGSKSGIAKPADFAGKKVGVPGIGAILHVLTENWLLTNGVDPKQVTFVETGFLQMRDGLANGLIDVVVTAEPTYSQILQAGVGHEVGRIYDALPRETAGIVYTATADWTASHKEAVRAFDEANAEAAAYYPAHTDEARATLAKYLHLTPQVANAVELPTTRPEVTAAQLQVMIDVMNRLGLLSTKIDPAKLLAP